MSWRGLAFLLASTLAVVVALDLQKEEREEPGWDTVSDQAAELH